ncbi:MAG: M20/M25/M40 family metallo-hydrolase [Dietzia sp.]|uniref:M20/M25/M40 family metallo-hydrolase n=7 Tax=Dietziaceae TaxID=85029 RepID=A0ABN2I436_9ACTN|nr:MULTISPECIES: M20/M25/M40 family metallo-hydrolase [unclassified Dietzia]MBB1054910.1 M20/M25/M40 family metallo-hydrolase [Dietzia sp. B44]MBC7295327.1 M20/M25/M40 family metallo-hydrolase [Dietzia sp.]MDO8393961.1 M20/M25/M40 family metallo-hydrolase [Dietzia sp.]
MTDTVPMTDEMRELLHSEAVSITADLVSIDSTNTGDPATIGDGETRVCRRIAEYLDEVGIPSELVESVPGRGSLFARVDGSDPAAGGLVVHGHVDVVPAVAEDWSVPPFAGEIHDGWLYGRGTVDMKNMIGMMLAVVRHYRREGIVPRRPLLLAFFADEEAAGTMGARWVVRERPDIFDGMTHALSEVGGWSVPVAGRRLYPIAVAEKGVAWARVSAKGAAAHASRPTSDNAVAAIAGAVHRVASRHFPVAPTEANTALAAAVGELAGSSGDVADLPAHLDVLGHFGPLVEASLSHTASPTVLSAGYKTNVIPSEAFAEIDCRVLPGGEETFRAEIEDELGPDVAVDWIWQPPIAAPADDPLVSVIREAVREADPGSLVVPYLLPASTDNKHLAPLGIHGYGFVPLRVPDEFDVFGHFHAVDERVPVDALHFGADVLARVLRSA